MKDEFGRRHSLTDAIMAYFSARPNTWIPVHELAKVGGFCGWRTRLSESRKIFEANEIFPRTIQWNGQARQSAYRVVAVPVGRSAETPLRQHSLFG